MDLLTRFCIVSGKRDYVKQCRSRSDAGEVSALLGPILFAKQKHYLNHKIIIIFIFYSFWRMAKNAFFPYEFSNLKSLNTH